MTGHDIIVIGTSAGGLAVLSELIGQLPKDLDAAIFIVQHISRDTTGWYLVHSLEKISPFQCRIASDNEIVQPGIIYIAPPDQHLLLRRGFINLSAGAHENRYRPSINVLFRSAALAYGPRVIGVLLTGMLDDGTSGLSAIHQCGGLTVVQDSREATYPVVSANMLLNAPVDYRVPIGEMGAFLEKLVRLPADENFKIPEALQIEAKIAEKVIDDVEPLDQIGERSAYTCPNCGGILWKIRDGNIVHYRCHTGHTYSEHALTKAQDETLEKTLWVAMRILEERKHMLTLIAESDSKAGLHRSAAISLEKAAEIKVHIDRIRSILFATNTGRDQNATD